MLVGTSTFLRLAFFFFISARQNKGKKALFTLKNRSMNFSVSRGLGCLGSSGARESSGTGCCDEEEDDDEDAAATREAAAAASSDSTP